MAGGEGRGAAPRGGERPGGWTALALLLNVVVVLHGCVLRVGLACLAAAAVCSEAGTHNAMTPGRASKEENGEKEEDFS